MGTFIFIVLTMIEHVLILTENMNEVIPYLERKSEKCPKLDGHNEWRQYHYWINKKLGLLPNTDLTTTLLELNISKFEKLPIPKELQNLRDYTFYTNYTEHQYENRNHIQIFINELFNGK